MAHLSSRICEQEIAWEALRKRRREAARKTGQTASASCASIEWPADRLSRHGKLKTREYRAECNSDSDSEWEWLIERAPGWTTIYVDRVHPSRSGRCTVQYFSLPAGGHHRSSVHSDHSVPQSSQ